MNKIVFMKNIGVKQEKLFDEKILSMDKFSSIF